MGEKLYGAFDDDPPGANFSLGSVSYLSGPSRAKGRPPRREIGFGGWSKAKRAPVKKEARNRKKS